MVSGIFLVSIHFPGAETPAERVAALAAAGRYQEAIQLADDVLEGPSDGLLLAAIESALTEDDRKPPAGISKVEVTAAWEWCLRLGDKEAAAAVALRHLSRT